MARSAQVLAYPNLLLPTANVMQPIVLVSRLLIAFQHSKTTCQPHDIAGSIKHAINLPQKAPTQRLTCRYHVLAGVPLDTIIFQRQLWCGYAAVSVPIIGTVVLCYCCHCGGRDCSRCTAQSGAHAADEHQEDDAGYRVHWPLWLPVLFGMAEQGGKAQHTAASMLSVL